MSLLQNMGALLGNGGLERLASGQGNFEDPSSPDTRGMQNMVSNANPQQLEQVFGQAAQQMDPQAYAQHVTPGAGGTDPLGSIGSGGLRTIANLLTQHLGAGVGGGGLASLLGRIPGLQTADPNQMDSNQVAALARYTQQNHPDVFGQVAGALGQNHPDLLHSFIGKAGLALGAAALASHFVHMDPK